MAVRAERRRTKKGVSRRAVLVGGGAVAGLALAWQLWPRTFQPNLAVGDNETLIDAFLKIDTSGQVIVVVPQLEMGQGVTTVLPQILADELGADWRTVAVQGAPVNPLYANVLLADQMIDSGWARIAGDAGGWAMRQYTMRNAMMLTGGSTSLRQFAQSYRDAGAAARVLLCKAAGARWDMAWESLDIRDGLVTDGRRTLKIGELATDAATFVLPDILPERQREPGEERLAGQSLPRLDLPSKVDGSHNFAADIRLPDMVFASVRAGPPGTTGIRSMRVGEARKVPGFLRLVKREGWVAAVGTNWWAANKALDALDPVFETAGTPIDSAAIDRSLGEAFKGDSGRRLFDKGDLAASFGGARVIRSDYHADPALHLAAEPPCATARVADGRVELWTATQAPAFCREAVAAAIGIGASGVTLYPVSAGGSFGSRFEHDAAVQAAQIASDVGKPVQLLWSRFEDIVRDRPRAPARARMAAKMRDGGMIEGLSIKVAAPAATAQVWRRVANGCTPAQAIADTAGAIDGRAVSGLPPLYAVPNMAVDHYPVDLPLPVGRWRGNEDSTSCFFTECFMDELAQTSGIEPMSFRMQHLGGNPRLATCLTTACAMGGWQGGIMGSGQGIACHAMDGGFIAVLIEAGLERGRLRVRNMVAVADLGAQPNPDVARQQIEGGMIFGLGAAMGGAARYAKGMPERAILGRMGLPRLADIAQVTVELLPSAADPAGPGQIGVPPVGPAVANLLYTLTGRRSRTLPLLSAA